MVEAARAQVPRGKRLMAPTFTALIMSHLGEMSGTTLKTVELITKAYTAKISRLFFEDGISVKRKSAEFRTRFKDAIMIANAAGFGTTLGTAGTPRLVRQAPSAFDHAGIPPWQTPASLP